MRFGRGHIFSINRSNWSCIYGQWLRPWLKMSQL